MTDTKTETTITLEQPCWIRPREVAEDRHFPTREAALAPDDPHDTDWTPPGEVRQLDKPCLTVVCACCGNGCDYPGECMVYHCTSREQAERAARDAGWLETADGWKCGGCRADDCAWHVGNGGEVFAR